MMSIVVNSSRHNCSVDTTRVTVVDSDGDADEEEKEGGAKHHTFPRNIQGKVKNVNGLRLLERETRLQRWSRIPVPCLVSSPRLKIQGILIQDLESMMKNRSE
jgi:hypothetical protein